METPDYIPARRTRGRREIGWVGWTSAIPVVAAASEAPRCGECGAIAEPFSLWCGPCGVGVMADAAGTR